MSEALNQNLTVPVNRAFAWSPATSTPQPWSNTGTLPPGLSLDSDTGRLTGTPSLAGTYSFSISNNDDSVVVDFLMEVGSTGVKDEDVSIHLDFDLDTGLITRPGEDEPATLYLGKIGDRLPLAFGFKRGSSPLVQVSPTSLKVGAKEFEPEQLFALNGDGDEFDFVEYDNGPRVRTVIKFDRTELARLGTDYEGDFVSGTEVPAEVELRTPATVNTLPEGEDPVIEQGNFAVSHSDEYDLQADDVVLSIGSAGTYRMKLRSDMSDSGFNFEREWTWTVVDDGSGNLSVPNPGFNHRTVQYTGIVGQLQFNMYYLGVTGGSGQITAEIGHHFGGYKDPFGTITGNLYLTAEKIANPPDDDPYISDPGVFIRSSQSFRLRIERDLSKD